MSERFISLKCESCGGKLDVYGDMERFACGYCGTEMVVQRRGGTVSLKAVAEALGQVQVGTDKMAAELALIRLGEELTRLAASEGKTRAQIAARIQTRAETASSAFWDTVFWGGGTAFLLLLAMVVFFVCPVEKTLLENVPATAIALFLAWKSWRKTRVRMKEGAFRGNDDSGPRDEETQEIENIQRKINAVQRQIEENRKTVNSVGCR